MWLHRRKRAFNTPLALTTTVRTSQKLGIFTTHTHTHRKRKELCFSFIMTFQTLWRKKENETATRNERMENAKVTDKAREKPLKIILCENFHFHSRQSDNIARLFLLVAVLLCNGVCAKCTYFTMCALREGRKFQCDICVLTAGRRTTDDSLKWKCWSVERWMEEWRKNGCGKIADGERKNRWRFLFFFVDARMTNKSF